MGEHVPVVRTRGSRKHKCSEKVLLPRETDEELVLGQDDTGKEMGHTAVYSQARVDIAIGNTSVHNYSYDINTYSRSAEVNGPQSDDIISASSMVTNFSNNNDDAVNPSALEEEPAALSNNIDVSPELPEIGANKDIDDNVCCVFCAKEVPVKTAEDLKKGQHLTRPGQSCLIFFLYRHHLFLKDIKIFPDNTAMLTLIHMTKYGRRTDVYETVESYVPGENLNVVQYNNLKCPPEAITDRAESSINFRRKAETDSYNLFYNNCETLIREVKVGRKISLQVRNFLENIANILMFLFCIASLFMSEYIRMFTFVAFCIYCIFFLHLAVDLSTYCKKGKIICGSCLNDSRIKIFCQVTVWTLIFYFLFYHEKMYSSYILDIGWNTCVFISSLNRDALKPLSVWSSQS